MMALDPAFAGGERRLCGDRFSAPTRTATLLSVIGRAGSRRCWSG